MKAVFKSKKPAHLEWPIFKWLRIVLAGGGALSLFLLYVFIFRNGRSDLILQFSAPVLAIYIASSGLMYNRARGMPQGKSKRRSLYAGERATQAFLFSVIGLLLGGVAYSVSALFEVDLVVAFHGHSPWVFVFFPSLVFVQWGYASYVLFLRAISSDLLYPVAAKVIAVRIKNAP
ncbi:hypothetical protein [Hydrogenophaga sp.]|uniref:hypothetical protein n=1 Tax=Hydrogenophaga sp. TaxID=1904254 RepID=UPI0035AE68A5